MGLLDRFEERLDRVVNGAFARAFKSEVQPVEIAAAIQREVDDRAAVISRDRTVVPNAFTTELSAHDYERLAVYLEALQEELAGLVTEYTTEQSYTLFGPVEVLLAQDDELPTGIFRVRSEAHSAINAVGQPRPGQPHLESAGRAYALVRAVNRLGRGPESDIRVEDPGVSRAHCEIVLGTPAVLRDLGSTNGTLVDGQRVSQIALVDGSTVQVGSTTFVYRTA